MITTTQWNPQAMYAKAYVTYHAWNVFEKSQAQRAWFMPYKQRSMQNSIQYVLNVCWSNSLQQTVYSGRLSPEAEWEYLLCKGLISCAHYERWKQMSRQQWPSRRYGSHNDDPALLKRTLIYNFPRCCTVLTTNNIKPTKHNHLDFHCFF